MTGLRATIIVALAGSLASCVPSHQAVFGPVQSEVDRRLDLEVSWRSSATDGRVPAGIAELLRRPLDRDAAIRIAVANNRRLQARYDDLGIAAASIAEATVLAPTQVDLNRKYPLDGGGSETEVAVVQDILDLLQIGQRRGIATAELAAVRGRAVAATVELVAEVESAFYDLVAAQQELELRQTAFDAAAASAEIVERMYGAGNTTDLALARERAQREQTRIDLGRAHVGVEVRRETLNRLLGLTGEATRWSVAWRLPELPTQAPALDSIERDAVAANLELGALRADAEAASGRVGFSRLRAWLPELGVGVAAARRDGGDWEAGPALRIGLPIFNQQQGPRARAHAELRRAQNELTATAVELRADARAARQRALESYAEARHLRDVVLPLRERVVAETLLQYNAMNASTFELLQARREQVDAGQQYIDALRRYWTAISEVSALRRGAMPSAMTSPPDANASTATSAGH